MIYKIVTEDKNSHQVEVRYEKEEFIHSISVVEVTPADRSDKKTGIMLFGTTEDGEVADIILEKYLISIESV